MNIDLPGEKICLHDGCPVRLPAAPGLCVRCLDGTVWITFSGETADVFLQAGETCLIGRDGLVESIGSGRIRLETTGNGCAAGSWLARIAGRWLPAARPTANGH